MDKLKTRDLNATSLSTYDFSTIYTTLPHNLNKDKLIDLIERTFIVTIQDIAKNLSKGRQVDIILLDIPKAFDIVPLLDYSISLIFMA